MIIKDYTLPGVLNIIENATNIRVLPFNKEFSCKKDVRKVENEMYSGNIKWFGDLDNETHGTARLIDYWIGDEPFRLIVQNFAYICNDDGKTIEKVEVIYPIA